MSKTKSNTNKVNATATATANVISSIFDEITTATCKRDLVDTMNKYGYRTNTTPTTTLNKNDLYFQLFDKSRILVTSKSLKLYTSNDIANEISTDNKTFVFDNVNDGSYRTKRATVHRTVDNFKYIFEWFLNHGFIDKLPSPIETK